MSAVSVQAEMDSSVITHLTYNYVDQTMTVVFTTGSTWRYDNVPDNVAERIIKADSSGAMFNSLVRNSGKYPSTKT